MLRFLIKVVWTFFSSLLSVFVARLFRGPKHPVWSFRTEFLVTFIRNQIELLFQVGPVALQAQPLTSPVDSSLPIKMRFQKIQIGSCNTEVHTPAGWTPADGALLYLHGGGYALCSPSMYRDLTSRISAASRMKVYVLDYRLAPKHPFPAALEDSLGAYQHLLDEGLAPHKICIAGDSAGGGLTLATLLSLRDKERPLPKAAVLLSPWVDLTCECDSIIANAPYDYLPIDSLPKMARLYTDESNLREPLISPLFADLHDLPPLLVQSGGAEMLLSENLKLVENARQAGVHVSLEVKDGMFHVWQAFARFLPEGRAAIASVGNFLRGHMTSRESSEASSATDLP